MIDPDQPEFTERRAQPDAAAILLVVQQMMRELLEMKAEIRVHINEEPHQIKDAVSNAVRQLVIEAFVDANVAQHKGDHEAIAERAQLRKTIEDENAAAIRKGLREQQGKIIPSIMRPVIDFLFLPFEREHCMRSYCAEMRREQSPTV